MYQGKPLSLFQIPLRQGSPVETEVVRVVSLSVTEKTELIRMKTKSTGSGYLNPLPDDKF